jgi:hypothetical protein
LLGNYEPVGELRKKYFVDKSNEIIIVPTLHPAATLYTPKKYKDLAEDLENIKNGAFTVKRVRERCSVNLDEQEDSQGSGDILSCGLEISKKPRHSKKDSHQIYARLNTVA